MTRSTRNKKSREFPPGSEVVASRDVLVADFDAAEEPAAEHVVNAGVADRGDGARSGAGDSQWRVTIEHVVDTSVNLDVLQRPKGRPGVPLNAEPVIGGYREL